MDLGFDRITISSYLDPDPIKQTASMADLEEI